MSFELKPEIQIGWTTNSADKITWTVPRSPVPPLLVGRVDKSTWEHTFDVVRGYYDEYLNKIRPIKPFLLPCCLCCMIPTMISITKDYKNGWLEIVKNQQETYNRLGVQVTLAKELVSVGSGSDRTLNEEIVGLHFAIGPMPGAVDPNVTHVSPRGEQSLDFMEDRLHKLENIKYLMTDDEYRQKRKEILADI